jgi:hypothetical protein
VGDELELVVKDDGVGGASLGSGSGLQGLEDRVGALEGCVEIDSPPGGGTTVMATIPLIQPEDAPAARPALSDDDLRALTLRRRRRLGYRLAALGTAAFVIVVVWALTGAPNAWPVWPLLSLVFVGALDAWRVHAHPPGVTRDRRHKLRASAGTLAIVNLFLIGIWLAAGAGYFWPSWVLLGSAVALALKAIPWSHAAHEGLQGTPPAA